MFVNKCRKVSKKANIELLKKLLLRESEDGSDSFYLSNLDFGDSILPVITDWLIKEGFTVDDRTVSW